MKVTKENNGQYVVTHENITLIHTDLEGTKHNDCSVDNGEFFELISQHDSRVKPLFIALHNYKSTEEV